MSLLIALILDIYFLVQSIGHNDPGWAAAFAFAPGIAIGKVMTVAYRRGTILRLERELAAQREWDEED
jgi:hypothetical protein